MHVLFLGTRGTSLTLADVSCTYHLHESRHAASPSSGNKTAKRGCGVSRCKAGLHGSGLQQAVTCGLDEASAYRLEYKVMRLVLRQTIGSEAARACRFSHGFTWR